MLLGLSSAALGVAVEPGAAVGAADPGVAHAAELTAFAEAAWRRDATLSGARSALREAVGDEGVRLAAMTVAVFRSLNVAADTSGIPLDADWAPAAGEFAADLGIHHWTTAANTPGFGAQA